MPVSEEKIYQLIAPLCLEEKIHFYTSSIFGSGKNSVVRVVVDTDTGITLGQCQELSKKIADIFYRKDVFQGSYRLEVTSPGVNKPLEHDFEYKRNIGRQIKLNYHEAGVGKSITGELLGYDEKAIRVKSDNDEISIPRASIDKAKIKLKW
jgi:ribosome maturation factor RimP